MAWYKNMTGQQREDFGKVIAVCIAGIILILLIPMVFRIVLKL